MNKLFSVSLRAFSSATSPNLAKDGYEIIKNLMKPEEIERIKRVANNVLNLLDERKDKPCLEEDYLYYSGGHPIKNKFSAFEIGGENKLIIGNGIAVMGQQIDKDIPEFKEFAYSPMIQKIVTKILKMKAPVLVGMSYIFEMQDEWAANFRKENSFARTKPLSTKGILISLSNFPEDEGLFILPNSHEVPPTSFLKRLYNEVGGRKIDMVPKVQNKVEKGERIPLRENDIVLYEGNLSYKMYFKIFTNV